MPVTAPASTRRPGPTAARALTHPVAQLLGWLLLVLSIYPSLWAKDGTQSFKLDAWIYAHAVAQWHAGGSLYDWYANPAQQLWPFTYPPFAAWVLTPLGWIDDRSAQVLMVALTPACVAVTAWAALRALGAAHRLAAAAAPWIALAGVAAVEPVYKTMEYGQVNAVLMAAVAVDLLAVPRSSRWRGALAGLAAAFKLTPAIAVLVLLARREWRAAATMTLTALGVTALAWIASPSESAQFFLQAMWDPGRAGFADYSGNQNLKGLVARWLPESAWTPTWALLSLLALAGAWWLTTRLSGRDLLTRPLPGADRILPGLDDGARLLLQTGVVMVAGLLVSPISWSHHWVWAVPALIGLLAAGLRADRPALLAAAAAGAAVFALAMHWWFPEQNHVEQDWPFWATVLGSSYTWWALGTGAALASALRPSAPRADGAASSRS